MKLKMQVTLASCHNQCGLKMGLYVWQGYIFYWVSARRTLSVSALSRLQCGKNRWLPFIACSLFGPLLSSHVTV